MHGVGTCACVVGGTTGGLLTLAANSPLPYPEDWLPTEPTEPAGDGVGDRGEGVPWPPRTWFIWSDWIGAVLAD